ncbi:MAG TPA: serine hydrolase domain-containing protein [Kofleriaceae bacterium]
MRLAPLALALVACGTPAPAKAPGDKPAGPLAARIDGVTAPYVSSNNFTGVIRVSRGGQLLVERAYGLASYEHNVANTSNTRFHIASISKAFTAAAVFLLVERGKLGLADPITKILPDYPKGDTIKLEHLLAHTSGIPNLSGPDWDREERLVHTPSSLVKLFADKPLDFPPGTKSVYSNSNYNLLAAILEQVTGRPYGELMRQLVFEPLELRATHHHGDMAQAVANRAIGVEPDGINGIRFPRYIDWSGRTGSGSLVMTASDLDRFVEALFGGRLVSPQSLQLILAPAEGIAFGWARGERDGRKQMRSGGRSPGFNTSIERYLDDGTTVIVLSNSYSPVAQDEHFLSALHAAIFERPIPPAPVIAPLSVPNGALAEYAGKYQMPADYYVPDAIVTLADRGAYLTATFPNGAINTFYPVAKDELLDRNFWARVKMTRDAAGKITGFDYALLQGFKVKRLAQ